MPPKFTERGFLFADGEVIPEHEEAYPREEERDPAKWYLEGLDTFSSESYPLATDVDTEAEAELLATARLRHLEVSQPTSSSGGQAGGLWGGGIQDRVYIVPPLKSHGKRFNLPQSVLFGNSPENPENQPKP